MLARKTANVLSKLPESLHIKAKKMLNEIFMAPTNMDANVAFDVFIEEFDAQYPKAVDPLRNHRQELMEFYNYPAEHWCHLRSTNIVESPPFATVRLRTNKTKGCGSVTATLRWYSNYCNRRENAGSVYAPKKKFRTCLTALNLRTVLRLKKNSRCGEIVSR
jgi:transposase-like protein